MSKRHRDRWPFVALVLDNWWVLPSFVFGLFTWLSFYVAGIRLHRRELIMTGTAYSAYSALLWFAFTREELDYSDAASTLITVAALLGWFGGAAHACAIAVAYEREFRGGVARRGGRRRRGAPPATPTRPDSGFGLGNPAAEYLASSVSPVDESPVAANTAPERDLARLPGLTPELVERWLAERTRRGGFRDLAELTRALDLAPHQVVRLRTRVSFEEPGPQIKRIRRGRVLDV